MTYPTPAEVAATYARAQAQEQARLASERAFAQAVFREADERLRAGINDYEHRGVSR